MKILVTGSSGFVGTSLCQYLRMAGHEVVPICRTRNATSIGVGDIGAATSWKHVLDYSPGVVIHLAARVHIMNDAATDPLSAFREVNVRATLNLAEQAANAGVRRFVFLSSVKVNGESGLFSEKDLPMPEGPYAASKLEAEKGLLQISEEAGMEVVVLRSPLVYGPGVKANFYRMLKAVEKGVPLPFSLINNKRSMIYLGNLVDALLACSIHPAATGQTYLVSDGEDVSTPELLRRIAYAMGKHDLTWPVPQWALNGIGRLVGKTAEIERLTESLQVDSSAIREELGWVPPYSMAQGLQATVAWYREQVRG